MSITAELISRIGMNISIPNWITDVQIKLNAIQSQKNATLLCLKTTKTLPVLKVELLIHFKYNGRNNPTLQKDPIEKMKQGATDMNISKEN